MMKLPVDAYQQVFRDKDRVLVVTAHPDDNEVICGGLVARLCSDNKDVRLVVTTNGSKGVGEKEISEEQFGKTRITEQQTAALALGVKKDQCFNLNIPDGELDATLENIEKIVWHIREFQPHIVITHCPDEFINTFSAKDNVHWVNHRDHRHTGQIVTDAIYPYSRDRAFFTEQLNAGLKTCTVLEVLYSDAYEHPKRVYFDTTDFVQQKRTALSSCPSVIEKEHIDEYIDETKFGDKYFEVLRYYKDLY